MVKKVYLQLLLAAVVAAAIMVYNLVIKEETHIPVALTERLYVIDQHSALELESDALFFRQQQHSIIANTIEDYLVEVRGHHHKAAYDTKLNDFKLEELNMAELTFLKRFFKRSLIKERNKQNIVGIFRFTIIIQQLTFVIDKRSKVVRSPILK